MIFHQINRKEAKKMIKTTNEVIKELAETLTQCDEEFIEKIANDVLTRKVKYLGGNVFEQK